MSVRPVRFRSRWAASLPAAVVTAVVFPGDAARAGTDAPDGFVDSYHDAVRRQDAAAVRDHFVARTPGERALVDVYVANELAVDRLADVVAEAFGTPTRGGGEMVPQPGAVRWSVEGDRARPERRGDRPVLTRTPAGWKLGPWAVGVNWADGPGAAETRARLDDTRAIDNLIAKVRAGAYRSGVELRTAMGLGDEGPAGPASRPVPRPPVRSVALRQVVVDLSTPRAAQRSLFTGIMEGDAAAVHRSTHPRDPADVAEVARLARWAAADARLWLAVAQRWGVDIAEQASGLGFPSPRRLAREKLDELSRRVERVDGDRAWFAEEESPADAPPTEFDLQVLRTPDGWKVLSSPTAVAPNAREATESPFDKVIELSERYAAEITDGRYATFDEFVAQVAVPWRTAPQQVP